MSFQMTAHRCSKCANQRSAHRCNIARHINNSACGGDIISYTVQCTPITSEHDENQQHRSMTYQDLKSMKPSDKTYLLQNLSKKIPLVPYRYDFKNENWRVMDITHSKEAPKQFLDDSIATVEDIFVLIFRYTFGDLSKEDKKILYRISDTDIAVSKKLYTTRLVYLPKKRDVVVRDILDIIKWIRTNTQSDQDTTVMRMMKKISLICKDTAENITFDIKNIHNIDYIWSRMMDYFPVITLDM